MGIKPKGSKTFFYRLGDTEFRKNAILIKDYPFEPASIYPASEIQHFQITAIHLECAPPTISLKNELIFLPHTTKALLAEFAHRNDIKLSSRAANWNWITEPFLDTEFDEDQQSSTRQLLYQNGFTENEVRALRNEIQNQMIKYNFDTLLWEWANLGLYDVLSAMKPGLKKEVFKDFYWRAMEIEQRS